MRDLFSHLTLCLALLAALTPARAQDVVPAPQFTPPAVSQPNAEEATEENRCLNGYNVITCSGENAKFAQAYDFLVLVGVPLLGALLFLFGGVVFGRQFWWAAKPVQRFLISVLSSAIVVYAMVFLAPFVPQMSPIRLEIGPLSWFFVDGRFVDSCLPCRDGVTNPGLLFGKITWLMPPHGLVAEHPLVLLVTPLVALAVWFLLAGLAFLLIRQQTGVSARTHK
jgi:hypothetical protein